MIDGRKVIAVIPARAGSKGVIDKNIRLLGGKPLLAWPILVAKYTSVVDRVIVSTDGEAIAKIAVENGAEVYPRDSELASDRALVLDVLRDLTSRLVAEGEKPELMLLLEPTAPFRDPSDLAACLGRMISEDLDSIATFAEAHLNPHRAWKIQGALPEVFIENAVPWLPRQLLPPAWQLTGTVYAFRPLKFTAETPAVLFGRMGAHLVDSSSNVDIDTETDLEIANVLFKSSKLAAFIRSIRSDR